MTLLTGIYRTGRTPGAKGLVQLSRCHQQRDLQSARRNRKAVKAARIDLASGKYALGLPQRERSCPSSVASPTAILKRSPATPKRLRRRMTLQQEILQDATTARKALFSAQ